MTVKYEKFLLNGVEYKTQLTQKWVNRKKWEEPNPYLLTSHIPGTIMQIEVKEGQEVQEGDVLLILQAMKMNNKLAAPFSGKIKKIYVNSGDKIPKGTCGASSAGACQPGCRLSGGSGRAVPHL